MIIVFSGTDGAGKSTQIERLSHFYENKNKKTIHLWSRGGYTPLFSAAKSLARKLLKKKLPQQGQSQSRDNLLQKGSVSRLWLTIAIIDLCLLYGIFVRFQSLLGRVVICDRYIDDTQLDFTQNFKGSFKPEGLLWRFAKAISPTPKKSFLLYVPVTTSQYRSKLKNEPFPDSPEVLEFRLKNYLDDALFPDKTYQKINCEEDIDTIHQLILTSI